MPQVTEIEISPAMEECIEDCADCYTVCTLTLKYGLEKGGRYAEPQFAQLLKDCADICALSEDFLLRGSERNKQILTVCADICEQCAKSCERFTDDDQMQECVQACMECAQSCRQLTAGHAAPSPLR